MHVIKAVNAHSALPELIYQLKNRGVHRSSRNGDVLMFPDPVTTVYSLPQERVVFWPERDANPFFHFFESLWMLAGRNDVAYPATFLERMKDFSDDGETLHGAYGHRWREHFGNDQLRVIAEALQKDPDCRRQVLAMWDPAHDLGVATKDAPCNTHVYFQRNAYGDLDMTVCCRSNDIIWGLAGANAVHFSMLQEYMAAWIGCQLGRYWQISNNCHAYVSVFEKVLPLADEALQPPDKMILWDPYRDVDPYPLVSTDIRTWDTDLHRFLSGEIGFDEPFFAEVAFPFLKAHCLIKSALPKIARLEAALEELKVCEATDWRLAAEEWVGRRLQRAKCIAI